MTEGLAVYVDTARTLAEFSFATGLGYILKNRHDLDRYERIIAATRPEVIVETGTCSGESAAWFAAHELDVITVDFRVRTGDRESLRIRRPAAVRRIQYVVGDSIAPAVVDQVAALVAGRRCMVSLDSGHTALHVAREIELYGPLVSPGCYLVVEDSIFRFAEADQWKRNHFGDPSQGNPFDAIEAVLVDDPAWRRDIDIERLHPVSHHPGGWWVRNG